MKTYTFSIFLVFSLGMFAQNVSKTDFQESEWFTNVNGESLFESDILILSKIITVAPKKYSYLLPFLEIDYLNAKMISTLEFRKNNIYVEEIRAAFGGFSSSYIMRWKLNSKKQELEFYKDGNVLAKYQIVLQTNDSHEWNNNSKEKPIKLNADILTLKLVKLK